MRAQTETILLYTSGIVTLCFRPFFAIQLNSSSLYKIQVIYVESDHRSTSITEPMELTIAIGQSEAEAALVLLLHVTYTLCL